MQRRLMALYAALLASTAQQVTHFCFATCSWQCSRVCGNWHIACFPWYITFLISRLPAPGGHVLVTKYNHQAPKVVEYGSTAHYRTMPSRYRLRALQHAPLQ